MPIINMVYKKPKQRATQGPAPSGFHVPLKFEWELVVSILTITFGLANNVNTLKTYLKMPAAGRRKNTSDVYGQDVYGMYWTSLKATQFNGYYLYSNGNSVSQQMSYTTFAYPIRSFKNVPISPDSNWTILYQGTGNAGIYHNSTLGLISISGDGTTRYTIADKNLGATTVYNNGDTLSEVNCGKYYQWGNNYGFPFTGSVTTSSTKVDASNYGPGNYYSSSTFINQNFEWDSSNNYNLRGGVDGNVPV